MSTRIVAGNWKMNGSREFVADYAAALRDVLTVPDAVSVLLFPPTLLLQPLVDACAGLPVEFGVQTVHAEPEGAFTGECSAEMAVDAGARWTLVGHSERRRDQGEDDAAVAARCGAALRAGLRPVLCVGESLDERRTGRAEDVVLAQLRAVTDALGAAMTVAAVAYEPVWAIGTGETASPAQAQAMHRHIRAALAAADPALAKLPLLYGGSVKADNAPELFGQADVDGGLVGGASLDARAFAAIVAAGA